MSRLFRIVVAFAPPKGSGEAGRMGAGAASIARRSSTVMLPRHSKSFSPIRGAFDGVSARRIREDRTAQMEGEHGGHAYPAEDQGFSEGQTPGPLVADREAFDLDRSR